MKKYTSAGIIVISYDKKILVLKHPEGHWGFPKGYVEEVDNNTLETAIRELKEETSLNINFIINPIKYYFEESYNNKKIIYYLGYSINKNILLKDEFIDFGWFSKEELLNLTHFYSKNIVSKLSIMDINDIVLDMNNSNSCLVRGFNKDSSSKHGYSRIKPLQLIFRNLEIFNTPNTVDAYYMSSIIDKINNHDEGDFIIDEKDVSNCWSIVNMLPVIVWKLRKVNLCSIPRGCDIGRRPIDLYLKIMRDFGFDIKESYTNEITIGYGVKDVDSYVLPYPSFTGTSIVIYLTIFLRKQMEVVNISLEPEIIDLLELLTEFGLKYILNREERILLIDSTFIDFRKQIIAENKLDRNVLVTLLVNSLVSHKKFVWKSKEKHCIENLISMLDYIGFEVNYDSYNIEISAEFLETKKIRKNIEIEYGFYPKLCSDWQPLITVLLSHYKIPFRARDSVFENRFQLVKQIKVFYPEMEYKMLENNVLQIEYISRKEQNVTMETMDLLNIRDAAAVIIACAANKRRCKFKNLLQLFRGYENINQVLSYSIDSGEVSHDKRGNYTFG